MLLELNEFTQIVKINKLRKILTHKQYVLECEGACETCEAT